MENFYQLSLQVNKNIVVYKFLALDRTWKCD